MELQQKTRNELAVLVMALAVLAGLAYHQWRQARRSPQAVAASAFGGYSWDGRFWDDSVTTSNPANANLGFRVFLPEPREGERMPILIGVGGLAATGAECERPIWLEGIKRERYCLVLPQFVYNTTDWDNKVSYQFAQAWSGEAVSRILDRVAAREPVDRRQVFLFGISAGAQFVHRFALLYPDDCAAVAAYGAGGYTYPDRKVATAFLIGVGDNDSPRLPKARKFARLARELGIDVELEIIRGRGHGYGDDEIRHAWEFFAARRR